MGQMLVAGTEGCQVRPSKVNFLLVEGSDAASWMDGWVTSALIFLR